ncbi:MAG: nitroreductase family deazaflavin-dependent oxidoreductase [Gammaproteobacteria bacterium]|nr:nitroreductase family deazaflavin-dependent oxidoreductase [Gammaproteobacteria bacterium]MBQ0839311.1 nitroreductase family deazaflavin-dependent oxidoreductase [Gammaproteobacteria bacterium]
MTDTDSTPGFADIEKLALEISASDGPGSSKWKMDSSHTQRVNDAVMAGLRENKGQLQGELAGVPALIITTTGAKSGKKRTLPLACQEIDGRLIIIASMGGSPRNPPWFHNLLKYPNVVIEKDGETFSARAVVTEGQDRERLFQTVCDNLPVFSTYQARTERVIPVVELIRA